MTLAPHELLTLSREYGVDMTPAGARRWEWVPRREIGSAGHYVGALRRLAAHRGRYDLDGEDRIDGRLLAVGWCRVSPPRFLAELDDWLSYWRRLSPRPDTVGSAYNHAPGAVYALFRAGIRLPQGVPIEAIDALTRWDREARCYRIVRRRIRQWPWIVRAARRASAREERIAAEALHTLGHLSAHGQRVALEGAGDRAVQRGGTDSLVPVRTVDLDLDGARALERQLRADSSGRLEVALHPDKWTARAAGRYLGGTPSEGEVARWLAPAFPGVALAVARRIARGESPVQLSGGALTRREAHAWLQAGGELSPAEWLSRHLPLEGARLRSVAVARWLLTIERRGAWGQLTRERTVHGPGGQTIQIRLLDRIDEIMDDDLSGPSGVEAVYQRATQRGGVEWTQRYRADHRVICSPAPGWRVYPRAIRALRTPAQIVAEGREQDHCVGQYVRSVEAGQSLILSLRVGQDRSTVEITPAGRVLQHHGRQNQRPAPVLERLLGRFISRIGGQR